MPLGIFLSTLSLRRATIAWSPDRQARAFLSTLSLRRATPRCYDYRPHLGNFYPRSPCGERRQTRAAGSGRCAISIHALLAESDTALLIQPTRKPDFYPRSPCGERHDTSSLMQCQAKFLSTLSLRRATASWFARLA